MYMFAFSLHVLVPRVLWQQLISGVLKLVSVAGGNR